MRSQTSRRWIFVLLAVVFVAAVAGLGLYLVSLTTSAHTTKTSSDSTQIFPKQDCCVPSKDLKGSWVFVNTNGSAFEATVSDNTVKVFMTTNKGVSMLYWNGTFDSYKPAGSVIASELIYDASGVLSQSKSKDFVVGDDTLSFDFTALGQTRKVDLRRV